MPTVPSQVQQGRSPREGRKYFTLDEARRALPLVKRILRGGSRWRCWGDERELGNGHWAFL